MSGVESQKELRGRSIAVDQVPNRSVGAAVLSVGIGSFVLGILAVIWDGSKAVASWLTFYVPTGPLSGVTTVAILVWVITWFFLARRWRTKTIAIARINAATLVLLGLTLLLTFPPFVDLVLGN